MNLQENLNSRPPRLTVGILTLNEEKRIAACIQSAHFADQILVIDSGSQDKTRDIAAALGAEVFEYADWHGFAVQRNRVLQHAKGEYIFFLDSRRQLLIGPPRARQLRPTRPRTRPTKFVRRRPNPARSPSRVRRARH